MEEILDETLNEMPTGEDFSDLQDENTEDLEMHEFGVHSEDNHSQSS